MARKHEIYSRFSVPVHDCPGLSHKFASIFRRRTASECPAWETRSKIPKRLQQLCYHSIAEFCKVHGNYFLRRLDPAAREKVIPLLSTDLPLELTVPLIREEAYWKSTCQEKLHGFDVEHHGNSHKRCYLETLVSRAIEQYTGEDPDQSEPVGWTDDVSGSKPSSPSRAGPGVPATPGPRGGDDDAAAASGDAIRQPQHFDCDDLVKVARDSIFGLHVRQLKRICNEEDSSSFGDDSDDGQQNAHHLLQPEARREEDLEKLTFQVVDYLKFPLALPNLKSLDLRCLQECGIDFSWNRLDFPILECDKLGKAIAKMTRLRHFRLYESRIDDGRVEALVNNLLGHPSLQSIELPRNAIRAEGAAAVAKLLKKNPTLQSLVLADNKIGPEGARHLAASIPNTKLIKLDVSMNEIENLGCLKLFGAIKKGCALSSLNVSANGLDAGLSQGLADLLRENLPKLANLDASCNHFGEAGGKIILDGLKKNRRIKTLDLRLSGIPDNIMAHVKQVLLDNTQIDATFMPSPLPARNC